MVYLTRLASRWSSFIDCRVHGMELDTYGVAVTIVSQSPVNDFIRIYGWLETHSKMVTMSILDIGICVIQHTLELP